MYQKRMFNVKCTNCGKSTTVPFEPTEGKPVYCKTCFSKQRTNNQERSNATMFNNNNAWAMHRDNWQGRKEKKHHNIFRTA
jgi:CxxC-x17-CxxC domain-containing protein